MNKKDKIFCTPKGYHIFDLLANRKGQLERRECCTQTLFLPSYFMTKACK